MAGLTEEDIRKIVREVVRDLTRPTLVSKGSTRPDESAGPRVLIVFHSGVLKLDTALEQVRLIQSVAGKVGVFTQESARASLCGDDVKAKTGSRCILDSVKPDGLEKVMERSDILLLPTFCMQVAARVAHLTCDDPGSAIVLSALLRSKKVLAANDGFAVWETLSNQVLRQEIGHLLKKLESFGMVFCRTEALNVTFRDMTSPGGRVSGTTGSPLDASQPVLSLVTAKDINRAMDEKEASIRLAPGGKVTPLARDLAKEYAIAILET